MRSGPAPAHGAPGPGSVVAHDARPKPAILGDVPAGDGIVHVVCREGDSGPARVLTVRRTARGWRLRHDELLSQL